MFTTYQLAQDFLHPQLPLNSMVNHHFICKSCYFWGYASFVDKPKHVHPTNT
jgi:hypothetical protein